MVKKNNKKVIPMTGSVEWFSKETDYIVDEEAVRNFDLKYFDKIFNPKGKHNPYVPGGYNILEKHIPLIQPFIKHKINLSKYDYQFCIDVTE